MRTQEKKQKISKNNRERLTLAWFARQHIRKKKENFVPATIVLLRLSPIKIEKLKQYIRGQRSSHILGETGLPNFKG